MTLDKLSIGEITELEGLDYIETTSERNGYPSNIRAAIIGLDSFEQAEELAVKYGLSIMSFKKKDGWGLWYRTGNRMYEAFENGSGDFGDNYSEYAKMSKEDFYENEVKDRLADFDSWEELTQFLSNMESVFEEIDKMGDDDLVITHMGVYRETISKKSMSFYHDTNHEVIGLIYDVD
jgi:hypothetical protein